MTARDRMTQVRADIATWLKGGGEPWDLPASAVHLALDCHGAEANPVGTLEALMAVSDECEECCGEGGHCEVCGGHRRVPKRSRRHRSPSRGQG